MKILRQGGEFSGGRIKVYGSKSLLLLLLAVAVAGASLVFKATVLSVLAVALAIVLFKANFRRWERWFLGKRGESGVTDALRSLSDEYVLLNDLTFPNGFGNVDHFLIGPNGLFVIETKNYSGRIKCVGDQWFINGRKSRSPSLQAKRNAVAVRKSLLGVFAERQERAPFVVPLLVFVKANGRLELNQPTVPVGGVQQLVDFIRNHKPATCIRPETTQAIVRHLQSLQKPELSLP